MNIKKPMVNYGGTLRELLLADATFIPDSPEIEQNPGDGLLYIVNEAVTDSKIKDVSWFKLIDIPPFISERDGLMNGGIVTWTGVGLNYDVSDAFYRIQQLDYNTDQTVVSSPTADPTFPRLDIVLVNNLEQVIYRAGIPAADPVKPQIDPNTEVELTTILVAAGATTPSGISSQVAYDENAEANWTNSVTGFTIYDPNFLSNPWVNTKSMLFSSGPTGQYLRLIRSGSISITSFSVFKFALRLTTAWLSNSTLHVSFWNGGSMISTEVPVRSGLYGVNRLDLNVWQLIQIDLTTWNFTSSTFDEIRFRFSALVYPYQIDRVELQGGLSIPQQQGFVPLTRNLTINGVTYDLSADRTWTINSLPSQATHNGKWLQTDGAVASWQNLPDFILTSQKGVASGVVPLDGSVKINPIYLPDSILGQVEFQTTWNATTNTPAIPAAASENKGHYYIVNVAGSTSIGGITDWKVGDWIISDGTTWTKVDNTDAISSFNTRTGAIVLSSSDVTTALGYTPVTSTRTITINGINYDLSADRSWTVSGLPDQTGHNGKFLTTDGSIASWATATGLPSQTGNSGKSLFTNGTVASWELTTSAVLTGFTSGSGIVALAASDTILQAFNKLDSSVLTIQQEIVAMNPGGIALFNYYNF